jgi:hypothetical protein
MYDVSWLATDAALFELPSPDDADDLSRRLDEHCVAWTERWDDIWIVGVELHEVPDLGQLLRTVEGWVAERELVAIRFSLDAKPYILHAGDVTWSPFDAILAEKTSGPPQDDSSAALSA